MSDETRAQLVGDRCLVVPGVRKGILRAHGAVVVTPRRLLFLPDEGKGGQAVERLLQDADEAALRDAEVVAAAVDGGVAVRRGHPGLGPPDDDGRLRLGALGEEDDLLIPVEAKPLLVLVMGATSRAFGPPAGARSTAAGEAAVREQAPAWPTAADGEETPGWLGPISGAVGAMSALLGLPLLVVLSVFTFEEVDDELGALLFLLGTALLCMIHLASFVGAVFAFARREVTRLWGLSTLAFGGLSGIFLLAGCLIALERLF